ncbi:MAG: 4-hydroxybenzoyl-CoA reductase subunit beta [Solirubrobacterales bacterium]
MNLLPEFRILRPASEAEALAALAGDGARPLAGGTDLLPNLRRGLGTPATLVDLGGLPHLTAVTVEGDGWLRIGAAATLETIAADAEIGQGWPALAEAALSVAGPTHRAAATLGGNLCQDTRCVFYNQSEWWRSGNGYCLKLMGDRCHVVVKSDRCYATYHGDVAPVLMVLGAEAEIAGPAGPRRLPIAELFRESGAGHLTLAAGELVVAVRVPPADGWRAGYAKVRVRDEIDFPLAGIAVALKREGNTVTGLKVAVTGTNSAPLEVAVDGVIGAPWTQASSDAVGAAVRKATNVLKTTVMGPKYRRRVAQAAAKRLAERLWQEGAEA